MSERMPQGEYESELRKNLVISYLQLGSVGKVMHKFAGSGISFSELHRELDRRGIIKLNGRERHGIKHAIFFFSQLIKRKSLYKNTNLQEFYDVFMAPAVKKAISINEIYRVWQNLKSRLMGGEPRRYGTSLLITPEGRDDFVLLGKDISPPSDKYGKHFGAKTLPIGFSFKDNLSLGALRIFQQEVSAPMAAEGLLRSDGEIARYLFPEDLKPFMVFKIVDVDVRVFHISLPLDLCSSTFLSSFKLTDYSWEPIENIRLVKPSSSEYRGGIVEIVSGYDKIRSQEQTGLDISIDSSLNRELLAFATEKAPSCL